MLSVCVIILLVSLFAYSLNDLIHLNKTDVKKNTLVISTNSYTPPDDLSKKGFQIAFQVSNFYGDTNISDPYYGKVYLSQRGAYMKTNETDGT